VISLHYRRILEMSDIKELKELDQVLSEVINLMKPFNNKHNVYWHFINEIMDDAYRLQDMVREYIRNEESEEKTCTLKI
jgi:hypothetical protein